MVLGPWSLVLCLLSYVFAILIVVAFVFVVVFAFDFAFVFVFLNLSLQKMVKGDPWEDNTKIGHAHVLSL